MNLVKRLVVYSCALIIISIGVVFSARCNLGSSPIGAVPLAISQSFGINLGTCSMLSMCSCVFIQIAMLGKKYKWINLTQLITACCFGLFVYASEKVMFLFSDLIPGNIYEQILYLFLSIILIASGVYLHLKCRIVNLPTDSVFVVIHQKWGISIANSKIIFDVSFAGLSVVISLIFLGEITAVGIGTIVSVILVGKFIGFMQKIMETRINNFLYGKQELLN